MNSNNLERGLSSRKRRVVLNSARLALLEDARVQLFVGVIGKFARVLLAEGAPRAAVARRFCALRQIESGDLAPLGAPADRALAVSVFIFTLFYHFRNYWVFEKRISSPELSARLGSIVPASA